MNAILIGGGDKWPGQSKLKIKRDRYRFLKKEESKQSSKNSSVNLKLRHSDMTFNNETGDEDYLDKRQVSFGASQSIFLVD